MSEITAHLAITNYDILEKIFSYLPPSTLKECRAVCKIWESVATPDLGTKTFLFLNKLGFNNPKWPMGKPVNPVLLRRIKIAIRTHSIGGVYSPQPLDHFIPFLTFHSGSIREIWFSGRSYFFPGMQTVLESVEFPKLQKLALLEENVMRCWCWHTDLDPYLEERLSPKPLRSVTQLELCIAIDECVTCNKAMNLSIFQQIIYNCPNLERLKVTGKFNPDLSTCNKIKSFVR